MHRWKCVCGVVCGMALSQAHAGHIEDSGSEMSTNTTSILFPRPEIRSMAPACFTIKPQASDPRSDFTETQPESIASQSILHESPNDQSLVEGDRWQHRPMELAGIQKSENFSDAVLLVTSEDFVSANVSSDTQTNSKKSNITESKLVSRPGSNSLINYTSAALAAVVALSMGIAVIAIIEKFSRSLGAREETV